MLVNLLAFVRALMLLMISTMPYRIKGLLKYRKYRSLVRLLLAISLFPQKNYDFYFSTFAFVYSAIYALATSSNPYASAFMLLGEVTFGIAYFNEQFLALSLAFFLVGLIASGTGNYRLMWIEYIVGDVERLKEIDSGDPAIIGERPGRLKRKLHAITRFFMRLFSVAYEPPNGLLVAIVSFVYALYPFVI